MQYTYNSLPRRKTKSQPPQANPGARERIFKAAERLFADHGFNGVSVRDIAAAAEVNSASIRYYFGTKGDLLSEVYRRHVAPMVEERLRLLAATRSASGRYDLKGVLEAFIRPALEQAVDENGGKTFMRLRAVLSGENSQLLERLVSENHDKASLKFIDALCECLPHFSRAEICWRFHFLLGAIYYTAAGPHRIRIYSKGRCNPSDAEAVLAHLIPFFMGQPA